MCLSAKVYTIAPEKLRHWWHQRLRWDLGGLQTFAKHKDVIGKRNHGMLGVWVWLMNRKKRLSHQNSSY